METTELLKKVRKIEIKTRGLSSHIFSGEYHSVFKGKGMTFSEVREYQYGDDIRSIDWNVTARLNHPFVKVFEEERELTVMLLIDVSGSEDFGTIKQFKRDYITEIAAVLSFSAIQNNDKVGVIFFSDKMEKFIPPKKGKTHILRIIRELITFEAESKNTKISVGLEFLSNALKKRCIAFLISDFIDNTNFERPLKIANSKHDLICIKVNDRKERELPSIGLLKVVDSETGAEKWIDTSDETTLSYFVNFWKNLDDTQNKLFSKYGIDVVSINTDEDYIIKLIQLFKRRGTRK